MMLYRCDKYNQIYRYCRDEVLRADLQPVFKQVDIEMSYPSREELFTLIEGLMAAVFTLTGIEIPTPLPQMSFQEAMECYGSDKPDTRFEVCLQDFTEIFKQAGPGVFREMVDAGQTVRGLVAPNISYSRKSLDEFNTFIKQLGGAGVAWIRIGEDGNT